MTTTNATNSLIEAQIRRDATRRTATRLAVAIAADAIALGVWGAIALGMVFGSAPVAIPCGILFVGSILCRRKSA